MSIRRWGLALLILSATGTVGMANVPLPIYKGDPGYERARLASQAAPFVVLAAVVFALIWAVCERSRTGKVLVIVFGLLTLLWGGLMRFGNAGTTFPDEQPGQQKAGSVSDSFLRPRGSPRPMTPEEGTLTGILIFTVLCFGGLASVRFLTRRSHEKGQPASRSDETSNP